MRAVKLPPQNWARAKKLGGRPTARKPPLSIVSLYTVSNISILHFLIVDNNNEFAQWLFNDKKEDTKGYLLFCHSC
ncbi:hypothetical protein B5P42_06595 [Bacillus sp. SRB_331]|nr:hypothetical protein B5P42_06595 [Bacillus sp. SRB_331]